MNSRMRTYIIIGLIGLVFISLIIMGLFRNRPTEGQVVYTDAVTGERRTVVLDSGEEEGEAGANINAGLVSVAGIQGFYQTINNSTAEAINKAIVAFVRAHGGPSGNEAAVVDAKVTQVKDSPAIYSFTIVVRGSEQRYLVTVTTTNDPRRPIIDFAEVGS